MADACFFLLKNYDESGLINVGTGSDISIKELAELIAKEVGYTGHLVLDNSKPDGTPRKLMDSSKINKLGWKAKISLIEGLKTTLKEANELFK